MSTDNIYLFNIKKGPDMFSLVTNFFSFQPLSNKQRNKVVFENENGKKVFVILNQISWADESGENWDFQGVSWSDNPLSVVGQYNTETKNGNLRFV